MTKRAQATVQLNLHVSAAARRGFEVEARKLRLTKAQLFERMVQERREQQDKGE